MKNITIPYLTPLSSRCFSSAGCRNRLWEIVLIAIGIAITCYFFYPGCMSGDSLFSWGEALNNPTSRFHNWHPPMVAYAWRLLNQLPFSFTPQYANLFLLMNILYWSGLVLAIRPWMGHKFLWLQFFICAGFFPPSFGILSQNIKDSLMCAALLAAYGGLLTAQRQHSRLAFAFGMVCLFLALGFRHNALFAVLPLALWAGFIFCQDFSICPLWKKIMVGIIIFTALMGYISTANQLLTKRSSYPIQSLYTYDLVGISTITGKVYLPELYADYNAPSYLEGFFAVKGSDFNKDPTTIENIRLLYSTDTNMNIYWYNSGKGLRFLDDSEEISLLQQAWLHAIWEEPLAYLKVRTTLYLSSVGLAPSGGWPYYCLGGAGDSNDPFQHGASNYYLSNRTTWMFKGITYIAAIAGLLAVALWKRRMFPAHLIVLGISGLIYGTSYFIIGVSADFRYMYWLIVVSLIMAINMAFMALKQKFLLYSI